MKKVYLVALVDQPQPHLEPVKDGDAGPRPITTPIVVLGDTALAVAGDSRLVRFKLPSFESAGESNLPAPLEWGPYPANDVALLATSDQKLLALTAAAKRAGRRLSNMASSPARRSCCPIAFCSPIAKVLSNAARSPMANPSPREMLNNHLPRGP